MNLMNPQWTQVPIRGTVNSFFTECGPDGKVTVYVTLQTDGDRLPTLARFLEFCFEEPKKKPGLIRRLIKRMGAKS